MKSVYLLWDVHKSPNGDDEKLIDVYLPEQDAEAARVRVHEASGFVGAPEGFTIDEYRLHEDHWTEGYVTV